MEYTWKLLVDCWIGPFTSPEEMMKEISKRPDKAEHILRTEIAYLAHTQPSYKLARPDLYKVNNLSYEEKLENLSVLLCHETFSNCTETIADLPTNEQVLSKLTNIEINILNLVLLDIGEQIIFVQLYGPLMKHNWH